MRDINVLRFIALFAFSIILDLYNNAQDFSKVKTGTLVNEGGSYGVAWIDYDKDGFLDLFVANYNWENYLYHNLGDGTFEKITNVLSRSTFNYSSGPSWGDFDNDGEPDLFVANQANVDNFLFRNLGNGSFVKITDGDIVKDKGDSYSSSWADYDNDGNLDIYVTNNSYFGTKKGESDFLYHNKGDGTFEKITQGILGADKADNTGLAWVDYNNDNKQDLFVTTWNGKNLLFKNSGNGSFEQITKGVIVTDSSTSLSCAWGDYNNDGFMDVYVGNGFPETAKNYLYFNNGDETFTKSVTGIEVSEPVNAWLVTNGDFDNDADLDLFVASYQGKNRIYLNNGDGTFTKITSGAIYDETNTSFSSGAAGVDYDNDGDLDLFIANEQGNNYLYNNQGNSNHWAEFRLKGTVSNTSAIGSRIKVKANINGKDLWQIRDVSSCVGMRSENLTVHFGLGSASVIDSIVIIWPSGQITAISKFKADSIYYIEENIPNDFLRPAFKVDTASGNNFLKVQFSDASIHGKTVTSWQWDFNNDGIYDSDEENPTYTFTSDVPKSISVKLKITSDGKVDSVLRKNYIQLTGKPVTNLFENSPGTENLKFENPVNSCINISYTKKWQSQTRLEIINSYGQLVIVLFNSNESAGYKSHSFNTDLLNNGFYVLTLYSDGRYESGKMLIKKSK